MALQIVESRVSAASESNRLLEQSKDEQKTHGQLLPGIPNEISVDLIAAKFLSWKEICNLSCVSRGWCRAVRSREVYRARVRLQSTETLAIFRGHQDLLLRSERNNAEYWVPLILGFGRLSENLLPLGSMSVPLDGRIFIIGGRTKSDSLRSTNEVYVLDLAGRKQWKPCASMNKARGYFGCGVLDGKIYVFGGEQYCGTTRDGLRNFQPVCGSEVYDPKQNTWKSITVSTTLRYGQEVVAVGYELVMHGGTRVTDVRQRDEVGWRYVFSDALHLEGYSPDKDDWRVPSENSDSWARWSTTFSDLLKIHEVRADGTSIMSRPPHLSV